MQSLQAIAISENTGANRWMLESKEALERFEEIRDYVVIRDIPNGGIEINPKSSLLAHLVSTREAAMILDIIYNEEFYIDDADVSGIYEELQYVLKKEKEEKEKCRKLRNQ